MNQKRLANIILVLIIVVLAGAVGYFTLIRTRKSVTQQTTTPQTLPTTQADEAANWKRYRNEKYGVEFQYPGSLTLRESETVFQNNASLKVYFYKDKATAFVFFATPENPSLDYDAALKLVMEAYSDYEIFGILNSPALKFRGGKYIWIFFGEGMYSFENKRVNDSEFDSIIESLKLVKKDKVEASVDAEDIDARVKVADLRQIQLSSELYYDSNNAYPSSLELLLKDFPDLADILKKHNFLYAYTADHKKVHLGILLNTSDASLLETDNDFNSKAAGYIGGFDGKDPVYDLSY